MRRVKTPEELKKDLERILGINFSPYENPMNHPVIKIPVMFISVFLLFLSLFSGVPSNVRLFSFCVLLLFWVVCGILYAIW